MLERGGFEACDEGVVDALLDKDAGRGGADLRLGRGRSGVEVSHGHLDEKAERSERDEPG